MIHADVYRRSIRYFLEPVNPFLDDDSVSEILINGFDGIFIERNGKLAKTTARFTSAAALHAALRNVAQSTGSRFDPDHPILETHLPDGSRIEALLAPIASSGPIAAIRKFSKRTLTIANLIETGSLDAGTAKLLSSLIIARRNILVAGGTGSGKTSLLNVLSSRIPAGERIIVIEDACELQLHGEHVVKLATKPADAAGHGAVTVRDLFKASLRLRPDRIVIGEIRGGEALDLIQAMISGHGGCLSTIHATFPEDALFRLETLALMTGIQLPLTALKAYIASAIDVIVQTTRSASGTRQVARVSEVTTAPTANGYELRDLFVLRENDPAGNPRSPVGPTLRCDSAHPKARA